MRGASFEETRNTKQSALFTVVPYSLSAALTPKDSHDVHRLAPEPAVHTKEIGKNNKNTAKTRQHKTGTSMRRGALGPRPRLSITKPQKCHTTALGEIV